ncbi:hypothetical protein [Micromonospora inyonensis]|uniref:Uncharacterized protein n=1 Tax=Micromonospora inyonensis TaxID=47866 RepID=A0A1C6RLP2_9ACTN|nr:hypothetical protein [Micromonospora inyonensis]SCL17954.1 hypothetical protein GA0074694_2186 [Micromonospora inyonensis]
MAATDTPRGIDVVMTTIGDAEAFFKSYSDLVVRQDGPIRVRFIVIPDRKTPPEFLEVCERARSEVISTTLR